MDLGTLISEATALVEEVESETVPVTLGKRKLGVRFVPASGKEWRDLVLQHPPREDVTRDLNLGYNVDAVVGAFPNVALVDGDEVDDMIRTNEDGDEVSKWPTIWELLTASSRKSLERAIWYAHEVAPDVLVVEAGKA